MRVCVHKCSHVSVSGWSCACILCKLRSWVVYCTVAGRVQWVSEVKAAHSCPTLCNPVDSTAQGILQARVLEWVAVPFSRGSECNRYLYFVPRKSGSEHKSSGAILGPTVLFEVLYYTIKNAFSIFVYFLM